MAFSPPYNTDKYTAAGALAGLVLGGAGALVLTGPLIPLFLATTVLTGAAAGYGEARHKNRMALYRAPIKNPLEKFQP